MCTCCGCLGFSVCPNCSFGARVRGHTWHTYCSVCSGLPPISMDGMNARGRENQGRQTDRQTGWGGGRGWGKPTLWLRVKVREFPSELDSFYIWLDWSVAWSSAATHSLGCMQPLYLCLRLVELTAKTKTILGYSFISNIRTALPTTILLGYPSCHIETLQQHAAIFGFSYLNNSVNPCLTDWSKFIQCLYFLNHLLLRQV